MAVDGAKRLTRSPDAAQHAMLRSWSGVHVAGDWVPRCAIAHLSSAVHRRSDAAPRPGHEKAQCRMRSETLTWPRPGVAFYPNEAGQPPATFRRNAMTVTIRQLHPHFFGEVSGVDLRKPLTSEEATDIEAGM